MANTNNGQFVWHEHLTKDPKAAIAFYSEVMGWKTQPFAEGNDYVLKFSSQWASGYACASSRPIRRALRTSAVWDVSARGTASA